MGKPWAMQAAGSHSESWFGLVIMDQDSLQLPWQSLPWTADEGLGSCPPRSKAALDWWYYLHWKLGWRAPRWLPGTEPLSWGTSHCFQLEVPAGLKWLSEFLGSVRSQLGPKADLGKLFNSRLVPIEDWDFNRRWVIIKRRNWKILKFQRAPLLWHSAKQCSRPLLRLKHCWDTARWNDSAADIERAVKLHS